MFLKADLYSGVKTTNTYGKKGDYVKLISCFGTGWIVENKAGKRFPVATERLTNTDPIITIKKAPAPVAASLDRTPLITRAAPVKPEKKEVQPINKQQSLF